MIREHRIGLHTDFVPHLIVNKVVSLRRRWSLKRRLRKLSKLKEPSYPAGPENAG